MQTNPNINNLTTRITKKRKKKRYGREEINENKVILHVLLIFQFL